MNARKNYFVALIGLITLVIGLILTKTLEDPQAFLLALPYVLIGLGCGIFGHGMGNLVTQKLIQNHPEIQKEMEIERRDERNIMIRNTAKSKAYDVMTFVFAALLISFAIMSVGLIPLLLLTFAYLFVVGTGIYFRIKFEKEM